MAMMRAAAPSTYILASRSETPPLGTLLLLPIPLPTLSPPLLIPSIDYKAGVSEVMLPPRKRLCITLGLRFEVGKSSFAPTARTVGEFRRDYGFVAILDDEIRRDLERDIELSQRMTNFVTTVRQDPDEIYGRLDDAQDDRSLMSGQLNLLYRDRRAHSRTARLIEIEARLSRKAWVQSMDASDTTRSEVMELRTTTQMQSQQTPARDLEHPDKIALKRTTRSTPATKTTPTTSMTNEQLKRLIDQGVADALAARDADRSQNGEDSMILEWV
ncbi:hypothetical protein Tco_0553893 [Tanacetum coccineum]